MRAVGSTKRNFGKEGTGSVLHFRKTSGMSNRQERPSIANDLLPFVQKHELQNRKNVCARLYPFAYTTWP